MKQVKPLLRSLFVWQIIIHFATTAFGQTNLDYSIGTVTGKYNFSYQQTPDQLVEIYPPVSVPGAALVYQWEQSKTADFLETFVVGTETGYTFSGPLPETRYYRRKATDGSGKSVYSNSIKIEVVSVLWEDLNYMRVHDILKPGITDWKVVDQLPIGDKLQTTTYFDGMGRPLEKVSREAATPAGGSPVWGDIVQFYHYDHFGRSPIQYLPYTITSQPGKYKTTATTEQSLYYSKVYGETSPYSSITYDNSPLSRMVNVRSPGTSWASARGNTARYDLNDAYDSVRIFTKYYNAGEAPIDAGIYPVNTLFKTIHADENGRQVVEYTNKAGQVILIKTQAEDLSSRAHAGWICVYSIYDDFGLLRYRLQPEAVKYLDSNNWSFSGTDGQQVLTEFCFRYEYDEKGRSTLKKAPGAKELRMLYDNRDRIVFMQDGNQSLKNPPEWTANLYDELDRPTITTLYQTNKTIGNLQTDIEHSSNLTKVSVANPAVPVADLVITDRQAAIPRYIAQNSIEFAPGFVTPDKDNGFIAEIDATAKENVTVVSTLHKDPITPADLNNTSICTVLKYQFYDDYSYPRAKPFDNNFDNASAYLQNDPQVLSIADSRRTVGFPTGSMIRVLGTNTFLTSTVFYDEKGNRVQTIEDNIKSGKDVTTLQHDWDGRLLSTHSKHTTARTGYANFGILTKNLFDKTRRVIAVEKKYGINGFKTIASYDYDDIGRLKAKHLDPGYSGFGKDGLETLTYSYNIRNNIIGINEDYARKTPGKYDKWGNYFGLYLGYDNRDKIFNAAQLDGHVTGLLWNTQGDDAQRKYDYSYDIAGRISSAVFRERQAPGGEWDNTKMDFSVNGNSGKIAYDLNGNLLTMSQKGILPGSKSPVVIDNLAYTYGSYNNGVYSNYSNRLLKVTDNVTLADANGSFGDFKDGSNGTQDDYDYDANGNLVVDRNKNAKDAGNVAGDGIRYNFLDKPGEIHIDGKGTVKLIYDAEGNLLQKMYTAEGSNTSTTTTYINEFVYRGDELQYINFEEGRVRVMQPLAWNNGYDGLSIDGNVDLPNSKKGVYDYYVRDYQENVRMILSEETHYGIGQCTMETGRSASEEPVFGQTGTANEVVTTRFDRPAGWGSNNSSSVSRVGKTSGHTIGPNSLLKVMAGDMLNARVDYYYQDPVTNNQNSILKDVVTTLVQALGGAPQKAAGSKGSEALADNFEGSTPFASFADPDRYANDNIPRAYLNVVFLDERFNFVPENSTAVRVAQPGDGAPPLVLPVNIKAPKNGYAFVYISNENDEAVYFDNLQVSDNRGRIVEEDHYYPFGLKIAGISSRKLADTSEGSIDNKNLYNDKELIDEAELDWYNYGFRNYDPQTARFPQLDPLTFDYPELTNYQYAGNDPVANVDLDGLEPSLVTKIKDLGGGTWNTFVKPVHTVSNAGGIASKSLSFASLAKSVGQVATNVFNNISEQSSILKWNATNRWDNFKTAVSDKFASIKTGVEIAAEEEGKAVGIKWIEAGLGGDLNEPMTLIGGMGPWSRIKAMKAAGKVYQISAEMKSLVGTKELINPKEIHFMQDYISNQTGEWTVLGNANALKSGSLNPEILRIRVWKDADGKIWTLDHRRLGAFRLSGLDKVPVKWTNPRKDLWKMSTKNGGKSIWLKFFDGNGLTIR